jgi:ankyrin repeat domain-containing protein 50
LHEADTGRWLVDSTAYSDWYEDSGRLFWLYGIAGSGKTVLFSTLVEDVMRRIESNAKGDIGFGYYYFDFQDTSKRDTIYIIRTLVRQICAPGSVSWNAVTDLYEKYSRSGQQPSQKVLVDLLVDVVDDRSQNFILIDAIDECMDKEEAVDIILELSERLSSKLNIMITSRHEASIEDALHEVDAQRLTKMAVRNAAVDRDISDFVKARMEKDRKLRKWRCETDHIVDSLVKQADGM